MKLTQNVDLDDVVLILVAVVHYSLTYMIDQMCAEYIISYKMNYQ